MDQTSKYSNRRYPYCQDWYYAGTFPDMSAISAHKVYVFLCVKPIGFSTGKTHRCWRWTPMLTSLLTNKTSERTWTKWTYPVGLHCARVFCLFEFWPDCPWPLWLWSYNSKSGQVRMWSLRTWELSQHGSGSYKYKDYQTGSQGRQSVASKLFIVTSVSVTARLKFVPRAGNCNTAKLHS